MRHSTIYSTTNVCCKMAPFNTSFWIVSLIFSRLLWGSVHMNPASTSLTLPRPLTRLMQNVRSSLDSRSARIQCRGGCRYLAHWLQYPTVHCFWIPSVMSTCVGVGVGGRRSGERRAGRGAVGPVGKMRRRQGVNVGGAGRGWRVRTCVRMQSTHMPAGLGAMPQPHMQHSTCPGALAC